MRVLTAPAVMRPIVLAALALTAAAASVRWPEPTPEPPPLALRATADSGTLRITSTADGQALLRATNLAPGKSAEGTVALRNDGSLSGSLAVSATNLRYGAGPGGGSLAAGLQLEIEERTDPTRPTVLFRGPPEALGGFQLGALPAGTGRVFLVRAHIDPALGNTAQGSSLAFDLVWSATADSSCVPPPSLADLRPPTLRLRVASRSALLRRRPLTVYLRSDERVSVTLSALLSDGRRSVRVRSLLSRPARLEAGKAARLRVRLPRPAARFVSARVARRLPFVVTITASARDAAGNVRRATAAIAVGRLPARARRAQSDELERCARAPADGRAPRVSARLLDARALVRGRQPTLVVSSDEDATATLAGAISYGRKTVRIKGLRPLRIVLRGGRTARLRLGLPRKVLARARAELRRRRAIALRITVTARDRAGNTRAVTAALRLRPRKR